MAVRAIRGATQLEVDEKEHLYERTRELVAKVLEVNGLSTDDLISVIFTSTPDLVSDFPAAAAREMGLGSVPLMCAVEIAVPTALPRVVRLMAHVETAIARDDVRHVYLHGATALRKDIAQ
ncbi:chorismate mutase [Rarobacter faecitabidus]|uniref:chorismate mutase n=1 Tax=Rarobacter faecitabidus TaxID=13243 RepID=A0A542ZW73_RARFA|nr:chorismate mutase [Rarobacter faecitabidus]TQL64486.1 chorismate mutase [Rarobacter faecitabidus]